MKKHIRSSHQRKASIDCKENLKRKGYITQLDTSQTEDDNQAKNKSLSKDRALIGETNGFKESFSRDASSLSSKLRCQSAQENLQIRKKQINTYENGSSKSNIQTEKPPLVPLHNNKLSPILQFGTISKDRNSAVRKSLRDKLLDKMSEANCKNSFEELTSPKQRTLDEVKLKLLKNLKKKNGNGGSAKEIGIGDGSDNERGDSHSKYNTVQRRPDTKSGVSKIPALGLARNTGSLEKYKFFNEL